MLGAIWICKIHGSRCAIYGSILRAGIHGSRRLVACAIYRFFANFHSLGCKLTLLLFLRKGDRSWWLITVPYMISLTSICCKILEHIIFSNIMNSVFGLGVFGMARRHALVSLRQAAPSQRHTCCPLLFIFIF